MKKFSRTLCFTALAVLLNLPALAAEKPLTVKRRAVPLREVALPASTELRPGVAQYDDQPGQVVYQVLLAEFAARRGDLELASKAYLDLAMRTRDPKALERTVEIAGYARRFDIALEAVRAWQDVDPTSKRAQQLMVSVMILANQLDELAPKLVRMLEVDQAVLPDNLLGLNRMFARNPDRLAVYRLIERVCRPFFGLAEAHYAVAMAASSAGVYERALAEIRRALELRPAWEMAAFLEAQLLTRESPAEAISFLTGFIERNPKAREAQLQLARALIAEKRYVEAKRHFDQLLKDYPDSPDVVYPVAVLALQQNDIALAEAQLKHFVTLDVTDKSFAYYYLGQMAEDGKRVDEALAYYALVGAGEQHISAQVRRARLLADQGRLDLARKSLSEAKWRSPEEHARLAIAEAGLLREAKQPEAAYALLDELLAGQPDQPDLLYETALLAERLDRIEILETRLRKLIQLRPDNAQAYNALGYSYAERNIRLTDARELIEKALTLAPDDSFILDSLGWVLFRQGDLPGALVQLEKAYAKRDDAEIAAHLGEVLWALGRKDEAQRTMQDALKKSPDNEALRNALKKLAP